MEARDLKLIEERDFIEELLDYDPIQAAYFYRECPACNGINAFEKRSDIKDVILVCDWCEEEFK